MDLLAQAVVVHDPATVLGQWVGIAVGLLTLMAVAVGTGVNLQRLSQHAKEISRLRDEFQNHEHEDNHRFDKIESWHRKFLVALVTGKVPREVIITPGEEKQGE